MTEFTIPADQVAPTGMSGPPSIAKGQGGPMQEIREAVHAYILDQFLRGEDPSELTDQTPLITGGILDSIRTLKLVVFLEDKFQVIVEAHEAGVDNLDSVGQIAKMIARKSDAA
jgi:acyl carrier protein